MEQESKVHRISVLDVTLAPLPLKDSPILIENALKRCLASSYWNLNYFRRKLAQNNSNEDFSIPARRWYYEQQILHSECRLLSFNKFTDNLTQNTSIIQIDTIKDLENHQAGFYFSENTSEDLFLSSRISETFPWPYNASGGFTTIEIFSPHLIHPLRYDERFSNLISVIKGTIKVIMFPMNDVNLQLLKPHPVYGATSASQASSSEDIDHPDVAGEWNIFRFSQICNLDQFMEENQVSEKIEIDVNAGEMFYIPFNFWYQIRGRTDDASERFQPVLYQIFTGSYFSYTIREVGFMCQKLKNSTEAARRDLVKVLLGDDSKKSLIEYGVKSPMEFLLDPQIQLVRRWVCEKMCASFCMTKLDQRVSDAELKNPSMVRQSVVPAAFSVKQAPPVRKHSQAGLMKQNETAQKENMKNNGLAAGSQQRQQRRVSFQLPSPPPLTERQEKFSKQKGSGRASSKSLPRVQKDQKSSDREYTPITQIAEPLTPFDVLWELPRTPFPKKNNSISEDTKSPSESNNSENQSQQESPTKFSATSPEEIELEITPDELVPKKLTTLFEHNMEENHTAEDHHKESKHEEETPEHNPETNTESSTKTELKPEHHEEKNTKAEQSAELAASSNEIQLSETSSSTPSSPPFERSSSIKELDPELRRKSIHQMEARSVLTDGSTFLKYGRRGKPHMRTIWLDEVKGELCWKETNKKKAKHRFVFLADVTEVTKGCKSKVFQRYKKDIENMSHLCLSVHTKERTIDLRMDSTQEREQWYSYISDVVANVQHKQFSP